jgi:thymidine phosphorylase
MTEPASFLPQETIRHKRDGARLGDDEIAAFVRGLTDGSVVDAQAAAFAMASFFRGLDVGERVALTRAMTDSGTTMQWAVPGPVLDKHSTGGVGDTVSLVLAPLVASCGAFVPMISGRGLGHTGGTLDKMASIPGYDVTPAIDRFHSVVAEVGCAVVGQTGELAPADGRLYAIRDVTATVESIGLITASILSKKLAAGLDALAMDVKVGNGAFMTDADAARQLAGSIVQVAAGAELPAVALLTDMDQPLASSAGNALEVAFAINHLTGVHREVRFHEVVLALAQEMLLLGGLADDAADAHRQLQDAFDSGAAAEHFARMVAALGGPTTLLEAPWHHLEQPPVRREVASPRAGHVAHVDTRAVGLAVVALGGGRTRPQDPVDHAVGLTSLAPLGATVGDDLPLAVVHARTESAADAAVAAVTAAYEIGEEPPRARPVILDRLDPA